jgi:predicted ester cyclase
MTIANREITADNKDVVRRLYEECLNGKNFSRAADFVATSFVAPIGSGPGGFLATIRPLYDAFEPMRFEIEDMVAEGDRVVVRWSMSGTHSGVWGGARPTGKSVRQSAIVIYQLAHRKIIAVWPMVDRLGLAQQLGLVASPNGGPPSPHAATGKATS